MSEHDAEQHAPEECPDCGIPLAWCRRVTGTEHCWRWDYEQFDTQMTAAETALLAADALADTYGRVWAKDQKFYAYQDARAALMTSKPSVRNGECGALSRLDGYHVICRGPAGHDGGHVWGRE